MKWQHYKQQGNHSSGVSGGEMLDVFWMHSNNADKYMNAGVLMNLNDFIAGDDAINMDNHFEGITPDRKSSGLDEPATIEAMKFVAEKILPACPSRIPWPPRAATPCSCPAWWA